jgi:hypothetical protein
MLLRSVGVKLKLLLMFLLFDAIADFEKVS